MDTENKLDKALRFLEKAYERQKAGDLDEAIGLYKASIEECDKAFAALTDATAGEMIKTRRGEQTKLGALVGNTIHINEMYGYMSVYMRLKGLVPPSSEK